MPLDARLRLERSRRVVDARVQDPTVVAGLLARDGGVFFDDDEAQAGLAQQNSRAVASPTIPAPTIAMSYWLRWGVD